MLCSQLQCTNRHGSGSQPRSTPQCIREKPRHVASKNLTLTTLLNIEPLIPVISPRCSERRDCSSTSYGYSASYTKDAPSDSGWLLMLGELALRALDDYARHRKQGKDPVFMAKTD